LRGARPWPAFFAMRSRLMSAVVFIPERGDPMKDIGEGVRLGGLHPVAGKSPGDSQKDPVSGW
jgi:hypothetical protein